MKSNCSHSRFTSPFSWLLPSLLWTLPPSMRSGLSTTEMLPAPRLLTSRYSCDCGECLYCLCTCVVYHFMSIFSGAPVARPHREVLQPRRKIDCRVQRSHQRGCRVDNIAEHLIEIIIFENLINFHSNSV